MSNPAPAAATTPGTPAPAPKPEPLQLVSCTAGGTAYTLPIGVVQEINRPIPADRAAWGPAWLKGRVMLRGRPVAVVDLGRHLSAKPSTQTAEARVVFLELPIGKADNLVGLAVDKVSRVLRLDPASVVPSGADVPHPAIRGQAELGEEKLHLMSVDNLFTPEQWAEIQAVLAPERDGLAA